MYLTQTQCYYRNQKSIISLALDWIIKKFTYIIITVPVAQWIARWTSNPKVLGFKVSFLLYNLPKIMSLYFWCYEFESY